MAGNPSEPDVQRRASDDSRRFRGQRNPLFGALAVRKAADQPAPLLEVGAHWLDARPVVIQASMLSPATDAGVGFQAITVVILTVAMLRLARRSKDMVMFILGLFVVTVALFGLRSLH